MDVPFADDALSAEDLVALRELAGRLRPVQHDIALEWARQVSAVQPEYFAARAVSLGQLGQVNEAFLAVILDQVERGDLQGLYKIYYDSTRQLLEADLRLAPSRPLSLAGLYTSARVSLGVIQAHSGEGNERLIAAYATLTAQLMMLVGQAYSDTREAYLQRTFEQINTVSHELRTPLSHLFSYLEMLRAGDFGAVSPEQQRVLGELTRETDDLLLLLQGTLDLSRLDTGRVAVRIEEFALAEVVTELVNATPLHDATVTCSVPPDLPPLRTDRIKVKQVIGNLLRNAIRYGGGAPVTIAAREPEPGYVELTVRDQGPGIRSDDIEVIFEFFQRGNGARLARDGYGIGLHVVRRLVALLGGRIHVESAAGAGACFRVSIPRDLSADQLPPAA